MRMLGEGAFGKAWTQRLPPEQAFMLVLRWACIRNPAQVVLVRHKETGELYARASEMPQEFAPIYSIGAPIACRLVIC